MYNADSPKICVISTHALREEGDYLINFGTTEQPISTHALREEGDCEGNAKSL